VVSAAVENGVTFFDTAETALVPEEFGNVIARGGAGVVIASQSGHRLPPLTVEQNALLAKMPVEELLNLPMLQAGQVKDSLVASDDLVSMFFVIVNVSSG
jgi:aryl-alcohol dehydrogenase-like predicted oxidoreductase